MSYRQHSGANSVLFDGILDVLSAGLALGHTGEGESFANYLENSYNSSRLGQPLTAAVMNACILSSHADKALEVFQELVSDPLRSGSEWQYGGEYNAMNPLCRDVAMRAMGDSSGELVRELALELYQQVKHDELQISADAIAGVVKACERDGKWKEAVEILTDFLDRSHDPHWLVDGNETMSIVPIEEVLGSDETQPPDGVSSRARPQIGSMLASVMRSCNAAEKFGMALLCCCFISETMQPSIGKEPKSFSMTLLSQFGNKEELVVAAMVSLCGLDCRRDAEQLYVDALECFPTHAWHDARNCYNHMQSGHFDMNTALFVPWESALRHIQLLINVCSLVETNQQIPSIEQIRILASALSKAMRACTAAGQPEAGLLLAKRVEGVVAAKDRTERHFSIRNAVASFFGYEDAQSEKEALLSDTIVLAETINAYRTMNMPEEGLAVLEKIPESLGGSHSAPQKRDTSSAARWTPVVNQAIHLLAAQNRIDDANALFRATDKAIQDHETLIVMATVFEKQKQWREIIKLYFYALNGGLLSEHLGTLAMKAVVETTSEGQAKQLRLIAKRLSELNGLKEIQWLSSRYWRLERSLGWNPVRLLMWWKDAEISHEMKLQFAIEHLDARQKAGLTPKNVAIRFIVDSVRHYEEPTEAMPFSRTQWLDLLRSVLAEAEKTSLWNTPKFVESACMSLFWLGGCQECVEFARDAVARGVRITDTTVMQVSRVAEAEGLEADELSLLSRRVE